LTPTIEELVEIIQIVLGKTVTLLSSSSGITNSHSLSPAIVATSSNKDVSVIRIDEITE
jgi:hypothetical protein